MSLYKALSQKSPGKFLTIIDVEWNKKIWHYFKNAKSGLITVVLEIP
jgi:hypothetical protein